MTIHAREDDAASESDFEWVNAWAVAQTAHSAPAAATVGTPAAIATPQDRSDSSDAEQPQSAAVPLFETAPRRKRWTHLFRIITRESEAEGPTERALSDAPAEAPMQGANLTQHVGGGLDDTPLDLSQIERDIAEIEVVRDRLLSEPAPVGPLTRQADRFAARTSDYVPILVGGVLAFMSLVVFAAAASFVSLR